MMTIKPLMIVVLAMLATVGGCDTINTTERNTPVGTREVVNDKRVVTDKALGRYARIQQVIETTLPGDILKVQVSLQNTSSFEQRLIYKFEWFDLNGMIVETPLSTWQAKDVMGKEVYELTGVAPTPRAKDFRLKLQESKWN